MSEQTIVLVKPDGIQRGLVGEIITRFERKGLKLVGIKMIRVDDTTLEEHYSHIKDKPFFADIKKFMKRSPIIALVLEGIDAVEVVRTLAGPTLGRVAPSGTIRGDFSMSIQSNVIHASDSKEVAESEIKRFFDDLELFDYYKDEYFHIYGLEEMPDKYKTHADEAKKHVD
ncbi:nucleoside-diphosphate kinase [candidate division WWE3 bacterium CG_4_9_14_3_um_filter_39_7]|uniref:Nucleoside diphosphate kinase n=1 Tax=candidate division WWE3 bacterium CG_4_9_14_3_um_filter_39_7 TaxID=1975080 RepID=A0A2M7X2R0_UNCKA|nr:MAG: nucleoside-diphosphate kinase [candidate division WWE3 bacterium CG_4_9_14_3_um_filter_39_7]